MLGKEKFIDFKNLKTESTEDKETRETIKKFEAMKSRIREVRHFNYKNERGNECWLTSEGSYIELRERDSRTWKQARDRLEFNGEFFSSIYGFGSDYTGQLTPIIWSRTVLSIKEANKKIASFENSLETLEEVKKLKYTTMEESKKVKDAVKKIRSEKKS